MDWVTQLHQLSEYQPKDLLVLARSREIQFEFSSFGRKGGVRARVDHQGKLVGLTVQINPSQSRSECEITLLHELFHIILGAKHPNGQFMMQFLDDMMFRFVEAKLDAAAYAYQATHPLFVSSLFEIFFCMKKYELAARA